MLSVHHLSIHYQNRVVLDNFNLNLESGEIIAMLGDSGSGKSSALRFIAGLDETVSGEVNLDGVQLSRNGKHLVPPQRRKVGMVFQDYALFPHMNIAKNIAFGLLDKSYHAQQQRVEQLLALIDLTGSDKKYPHQLSGGEQQRVALARTLAPSPQLLLLDEPFSSSDKNHRNDLIMQVRKILKDTGVSSILVTHDKTEAHLLADKVAVIHNKKLTTSEDTS